MNVLFLFSSVWGEKCHVKVWGHPRSVLYNTACGKYTLENTFCLSVNVWGAFHPFFLAKGPWVVLHVSLFDVCPCVSDVSVWGLWGPWQSLQLMPIKVVHCGFWGVFRIIVELQKQDSFCLRIFLQTVWCIYFNLFLPLLVKCFIKCCNSGPKCDRPTLFNSWKGKNEILCRFFSPILLLLVVARRFDLNSHQSTGCISALFIFSFTNLSCISSGEWRKRFTSDYSSLKVIFLQ